MKASDLVDKSKYPAVWTLLDLNVEMQFADLRVMLQLRNGRSAFQPHVGVFPMSL